MHRSCLRLCRAVCVAGVVLLCAGCTLVSPGCRNREVKAAIEQEARVSIDFWLTTSKQRSLPNETAVRLVEPVEESRRDMTRACSAKVSVGGGGKQLEVPIEYEVIAGDDGQAFYRWDKEGFGKAYIAFGAMSLLSSLAQPSASEGAGPRDEAPVTQREATDNSSTASKKLDENKPSTAIDRLAFERWHDEVTARINAQSVNVRIEGSGSVSVGFEVSAIGQLSDIKILQGSGDAGLDKAATQMVEKTGRVRPPPDQRATTFSMKLSFL